jgi:hypothetical protein
MHLRREINVYIVCLENYWRKDHFSDVVVVGNAILKYSPSSKLRCEDVNWTEVVQDKVQA